MNYSYTEEYKVNYRKHYYKKHKEKLNAKSKKYREANKQKLAEADKSYRQANPKLALWQSAKQRSKKKQIEFSIVPDDIIIPDKCPILQVSFEYGTEYSMSLDRKDNTKGYVPGNIQVICKKANSMKNNATAEELRKFAKWVIFSV